RVVMSPDSQRRQVATSWIIVGVLFALCALLAVLQYRWIGEVSVAARDRMRTSLQGSLDRVSRDFQSELSAACRAIGPEGPGGDSTALVNEIGERYAAWKAADHQGRLFREVALVTREGETLVLRR